MSNSSTASTPTTPASAATRRARSAASPRTSASSTPPGDADLTAHPVDLGGLDGPPGDRLAAGSSSDERRELAAERHALLGDDADAGAAPRRRRVAGLFEPLGDDHAATVVPAAGRLDHRDGAPGPRELAESREVVVEVALEHLESRHGHASRVEHPTLLGLVDREQEARRCGPHHVARSGQGPNRVEVDQLVVEGHDVAGRREAAEVRGGARAAEDGPARDLARRRRRGARRGPRCAPRGRSRTRRACGRAGPRRRCPREAPRGPPRSAPGRRRRPAVASTRDARALELVEVRLARRASRRCRGPSRRRRPGLVGRCMSRTNTASPPAKKVGTPKAS